jgi:hypothetical protein
MALVGTDDGYPRIKCSMEGQVIYVCGKCFAHAWRHELHWNCPMCGGLDKEVTAEEAAEAIRYMGVMVRKRPTPSRKNEVERKSKRPKRRVTPKRAVARRDGAEKGDSVGGKRRVEGVNWGKFI